MHHGPIVSDLFKYFRGLDGRFTLWGMPRGWSGCRIARVQVLDAGTTRTLPGRRRTRSHERPNGDEGKSCKDALPRHRTFPQVRCHTRQCGTGRRLIAPRQRGATQDSEGWGVFTPYAGLALDAARSGEISRSYRSKLSCTAFFARSGPKKSCTRTLLFSSFL